MSAVRSPILDGGPDTPWNIRTTDENDAKQIYWTVHQAGLACWYKTMPRPRPGTMTQRADWFTLFFEDEWVFHYVTSARFVAMGIEAGCMPRAAEILRQVLKQDHNALEALWRLSGPNAVRRECEIAGRQAP